jgi:CDP-diacylglycerol--serine O-phosphatidyltransferase
MQKGVCRTLIGYYNKSVIATYIGLVCSIFGMAAAMRGMFREAMILLMVCGMFDMIDGPIARKCSRTDDEKSFGIQIDSLCDMVCFGAQPAVVCLAMPGVRWYFAVAAAFYVLTGVIRLGYFNVQEINRVRSDPGRRKCYDGLPITSGALIMPAVAAAEALMGGFSHVVYPISLAVTGVMFIAPVHIPKLHLRGMIMCALMGLAVLMIMIFHGGVLNV